MNYDTVDNVLWPYRNEPDLEKCKGCGDEFPPYELEDGLCSKCKKILDY